MRINSNQWMELQREHHELLKLYFSLKHELEQIEEKIDTLQNSQTRITISDPPEQTWTWPQPIWYQTGPYSFSGRIDWEKTGEDTP